MACDRTVTSICSYLVVFSLRPMREVLAVSIYRKYRSFSLLILWSNTGGALIDLSSINKVSLV